MDYPPFIDAIARFRTFLGDQGHHDPIRWVFPDDVLLVGGRWLIHPREPAEVAEGAAAITYQRGVARRLGVKFGVLCCGDGFLWCYVYLPTDTAEAQYALMPDGLKLSVPIPVAEGRVLVDEMEWARLRSQDQVEFKPHLSTW